MRGTDGHGVIDEYVAGLRRRLVGPARLKDEMLAEARDGLLDAARAHEADGLDPAAARRQAIAEFGGYAEVAPAYQVELAAAQGRSTALVIAAALVALRLVAPLVWVGDDVAWVATLVGAFDALAVDTGLALTRRIEA